MARFRPRFRLLTLVIVIAVIAIGVSSTRWWIAGRRQILARADDHEKKAGMCGTIAQGEERSSGQDIKLARAAVDSRRATKDFLQKWRNLEKVLGLENSNHEDSCMP